MAKHKWNYDVFDTKDEIYILENSTIDDVSKMTGIPKRDVANYATNQWLYNGKYRISRIAVDMVEKNKSDNIKTEMPSDWIADWNKVRLKINPNASVCL